MKVSAIKVEMSHSAVFIDMLVLFTGKKEQAEDRNLQPHAD